MIIIIFSSINNNVWAPKALILSLRCHDKRHSQTQSTLWSPPSPYSSPTLDQTHKMAPLGFLSVLANRADAAANEPTTVSEFLASQWRNPSDILSVLMLLAPDIVQKAIAQASGRAITPVAFSFGWVAYAAATLLRVFGGGFLD